MQNLSQIVGDLLLRNGLEPRFDPLRLEWSKWFRCESSFSVLLAPCKPGIFALGEEMVPSAEGSKRMLALFQVSETDDVGMALGRLFLPGNPLRERLSDGRCFARYAVIEDPAQRTVACGIFQRWLQQSSEVAAGIGSGGTEAFREPVSSISSGSGMEMPARENLRQLELRRLELGQLELGRLEREATTRPAPLPSGF